MSTNIRIIKRAQRDAAGKTANSREPNPDNTRQSARDITGHVATWIKELRQRHTPDPRRAFANLFVDPATSSLD